MPPVAPSEYPPPFDSESVITAPTDPEDERIEVGVAIVGGGPAGLAAAVKTLQLLEDKPELMEKLGEVPVAVVEKGKVCGAHAMSGANMRPSAMEELFPDMPRDEWPVYREVDKDAVYLRALRRLSGLDYEEFEDLLHTMATVADEWDDRLAELFPDD